MPDIRSIITLELIRRGWSIYHLTSSLPNRPDIKPPQRVPLSTVQDWLTGRTKSINSLDLGLILDTLDLQITPTHPPKPTPVPSSKSRSPAKRPKKAS